MRKGLACEHKRLKAMLDAYATVCPPAAMDNNLRGLWSLSRTAKAARFAGFRPAPAKLSVCRAETDRKTAIYQRSGDDPTGVTLHPLTADPEQAASPAALPAWSPIHQAVDPAVPVLWVEPVRTDSAAPTWAEAERPAECLGHSLVAKTKSADCRTLSAAWMK
jgi:hypothetical protein